MIKDFLRKKGYNVNIVGCNYFTDLLEEVTNMMLEGKEDSEIKELFPSLCLEFYHFCYEVSRFKFLEEVDYFSKNSYAGDDDAEKDRWNENIDDKIIRLAKEYISEKEKEEKSSKQLVKIKM